MEQNTQDKESQKLPKRPLTRTEVADFLQVSTRTVDRLCEDGLLKFSKLGPRYIRFNLDDVLAAMQLKGNYLHHIYQYTGLGLKVSPRSLLWALSVYDSILKELEEIGYKLDFSGNGLEIIKHNIKISVYIYEKKKTVKIAKGNKKYKLTGLLALSVFGTFGVEGTISESKKHGFKNRLLNIVNYIEGIVSKSREKKRDFRLGCLKTRRQEQRKVRAKYTEMFIFVAKTRRKERI